MQRSNFEKELHRHQRRHDQNWTSLKQRRKNQKISIILEEESSEDSTIFEGEINTHHMDMMGHVIHIFHIFFILVS
jgi:hypothetical protein